MRHGDLKSLCSLWTHLASNQRYCSYIEKEDISTFLTRATNEGLSFLTLVLPRIGKAIDKLHSTKVWSPPEGFATFELGLNSLEDTRWGLLQSTLEFSVENQNRVVPIPSVQCPRFMNKAIRKAVGGDPVAVDCVRQLSYLFYKLEVRYESRVIDHFLDRFVSTDLELGQFWSTDVGSTRSRILGHMKDLIGRILAKADPLDIVPSHGAGATACRTPNYEKYHKLRYFKKLDDCFSYSEYFFYNFSHLCDELEKLENAPIADPQARVCLVPKDSRGPRIISCEPAELMYIQQGLMRKLYKTIEDHTITRGQINFTDQQVNRKAAMYGSISNRTATIDLSDASDRVSLDLIRAVFPQRWVEALEASRSETTQLPNGMVVKLNKFAPMGSSCCFPVEALVFWTCAQAAIREYSRHGVAEVLVYGDDIIVSSNIAEDVMRGLELIGLMVNRDKSYVDGPFRESCGGDYYLGVDVTPVRLRNFLGMSGTLFENCADFINNLIMKFGYESVHRLILSIEDEIGYTFPRTLLALPGTIRVNLSAVNDVRFKRRWNSNYQRYEHRILQLASKVTQRQPPEWGELLRKELSRGILNRPPEGYISQLAIQNAKLDPGQYADPHSVKLVWKWTWLG